MSDSEYLAQLIGDVQWDQKDEVIQWLNNRAAEGWQLVTMDNGAGYFVRGRSAPTNVAVPFVSQSGTQLHCTMGEWTQDPTSYAYQWQIGGAAVGTDSPQYARVSGDVGKTATCVVTASNASGSATAPPSNGLVVK